MSNRIILPETKKFLLRVNDRNNIDQEFYKTLYDRGVMILHARSTQAALKLMGQASIDVVTTNLRREEQELFNPMAGIELIKEIRKIGSRVPIIMYSMNISPALEKLVLEAGADKIAVDPAELYGWLESVGI